DAPPSGPFFRRPPWTRWGRVLGGRLVCRRLHGSQEGVELCELELAQLQALCRLPQRVGLCAGQLVCGLEGGARAAGTPRGLGGLELLLLLELDRQHSREPGRPAWRKCSQLRER